MKLQLIGLCIVLMAVESASARDWYVSAKGAGRAGTKQAPARDLGNLELADGDRVFIAGGEYKGRGDSGVDEINVPVEISGGWDDSFMKRDPWGTSRTIFTGDNASKNWKGGYRLSIDLSKRRPDAAHKVVVDGVIFDNAGRNHYTADESAIVRPASRAKGKNPTPESGGLSIRAGKRGDIVVRNCVVMNTAPTVGAFSIWGNQASKVAVENNLAINNTGVGFALHTLWVPRDGRDMPVFTFTHNTAMFHEKHDPLATYGGSGMKMESKVIAANNVFAFNDYHGVDNVKNVKGIELRDNLFAANAVSDYLEFDTRIDVPKLKDEARCIEQPQGNVAVEIKPPVEAAWAAKYAARNVIDRRKAEAEVKAAEGKTNEMRRMLGLNVEGGQIDVKAEVWLPRMSVEDALKVGRATVDGRYGCRAPKD